MHETVVVTGRFSHDSMAKKVRSEPHRRQRYSPAPRWLSRVAKLVVRGANDQDGPLGAHAALFVATREDVELIRGTLDSLVEERRKFVAAKDSYLFVT